MFWEIVVRFGVFAKYSGSEVLGCINARLKKLRTRSVGCGFFLVIITATLAFGLYMRDARAFHIDELGRLEADLSYADQMMSAKNDMEARIVDRLADGVKAKLIPRINEKTEEAITHGVVSVGPRNSAVLSNNIQSQPKNSLTSQDETATSVPYLPQSMIVPGIGSINIVTVGLLPNRQVDTPSNIQMAGWFDQSAMPGSRGAAFIDGHTPGVFSGLKNITTGNEITITMSDGEIFRYRVMLTETVALENVNMMKAMSAYGGEREGLNLMTCAGQYDSARGTYDHRLIVYAVRI